MYTLPNRGNSDLYENNWKPEKYYQNRPIILANSQQYSFHLPNRIEEMKLIGCQTCSNANHGDCKYTNKKCSQKPCCLTTSFGHKKYCEPEVDCPGPKKNIQKHMIVCNP